MSFASEVREELCRVLPEKRCCRMAECYGILMYCNTFSKNEIKIITESRQFAELLPRLPRERTRVCGRDCRFPDFVLENVLRYAASLENT